MNVDDMIMVSIDDHVVEPPDVFARHMPERFRDRVPKLMNDVAGVGKAASADGIEYAVGVDRWVFQGESIGVPGIGAVMSWPDEEWSMDPCSLAEMRPGTYDVHERVRDMNANGTLASMNFPSFPGFSATHLARMPDRELTNFTVSAYNDWLIDEWAGAAPGRFLPMTVLPFFDVDASVAEVRRVAAKGSIAVTLPETPYGIGVPDYGSGYWDPIFEAMCDTGQVGCLHIGGAYGLLQRPESATVNDLFVLTPQLSAITCNDILLSGRLRMYPDLRFALSEGGIGWIPFFLDKFEHVVRNQSWAHFDKLPQGKTVSEIYREHFLACFISDPSALRLRDRIGVETIAWECDFPHSDSRWPNSPEILFAELAEAGCGDAEIDAITWENAARFFGFDPFLHIEKHDATVGALRAAATADGVDTSTTSRAEYRRRWEAHHRAIA
ncbi:MAG: amidohydrolase family protein [Ilumatobacteraceae bacterium]